MRSPFRRTAVAVTFVVLAAGAAGAQEKGPATPGDGFTIHVTAPHIMGDRLIDPMHHYCKVISPEPIIQCLMFDSTDPNARLLGVEYIGAKSIVRREISLGDWNRDWHDHAVEIEAGVVKLPDMTPEQASEVAKVVMNTDGIVFMLWPEGARIPNGEVGIAQAISHNILTPAEYEAPLRTAGGGN